MVNDNKENFLQKISGKNVNFLIGSGASSPLFRTLQIDGKTGKISLEDLFSDKTCDDEAKKVLSYYYYSNWIKPMLDEFRNSQKRIESLTKEGDKHTEESKKNNDEEDKNEEKVKCKEKYDKFINGLVQFLRTESNERPKRINIFTTNYDLLFEETFQEIVKTDNNVFFNDGSVGFIDRVLCPQNLNLSVSRTGYFDVYKNEIPTINLIKLHGSISWRKFDKDIIEVDYNLKKNDLFDTLDSLCERLDSIDDQFRQGLYKRDYSFLKNLYANKKDEYDAFYENYRVLSIINPDKWKFHETVFERHYYQQLRNLSYELEREQTVLIVFGFSFADEHIKDIVKVSLSNPTLKVFVISYKYEDIDKYKQMFSSSQVEYLPINKGEVGDFDYLNSLIVGDYDVN